MPRKESVLAIEGDRPDCSFDGVGIQFYPAIIEEFDETSPVFGDVFKRFPDRRLGGHTGTAVHEPDFHLFDYRFRALLPCHHSIRGTLAPNVLLDLIELSDLGNPGISNGRCVARFGDLEEFTTCMCPAVSQAHILCRPLEQPVVACIAVNLQGAGEALQDVFGLLAGSPRRVGKSHAWRVFATPRTVIAGQGPEVSGFGLSPPRIENRGDRLVHEEL